jgi:hypothetical protein
VGCLVVVMVGGSKGRERDVAQLTFRCHRGAGPRVEVVAKLDSAVE